MEREHQLIDSRFNELLTTSSGTVGIEIMSTSLDIRADCRRKDEKPKPGAIDKLLDESTADSWDECSDKCQAQKECEGWSFSEAESKCSTFFFGKTELADSDYEESAGVTSGMRFCIGAFKRLERRWRYKASGQHLS